MTSPPTPPFAGSVVELDVRDDLRQRREPFARIMAAVDALAPDEVLHLRATFEPVPLFRVLAKRGFAHHAVAHAPDDWSAWFQRADQAPDAVDAAAASVAPSVSAHEVWLDVRSLEPPEPMTRTLAALEALPAGATLVQVNVRVPQFLLPLLAERGFAYAIDESAADRVIVRISPTRRHPVSASPIELDVRVIPPRDKHPTIFRTFDSLASGQSMVIVNDHDPRPLRYQLLAERPESFEWTYQAEGPEEWRVRIDRK